MSKRFFFGCLLLLGLCLNTSAQIIEWALYDIPSTATGRFNNGLVTLYQRNKGYGLMNYEGKVLLEPGYQFISLQNYGIAIVKDHNQHYGVINSEGEWILDLSYDNIQMYGALLVVKNKEGKEGIFDCYGNQILSFDYKIHEISNFPLLEISIGDEKFISCYATDSVYECQMGRELGSYYSINDSVYIDKNGKEFNFEYVNRNSFGAKLYKKDNKLNLRKKDGNTVDILFPLNTYDQGVLYTFEKDTLRCFDVLGNCKNIPCYSAIAYENGIVAYWPNSDFSKITFLNKDGKVLLKDVDGYLKKQTPYILTIRQKGTDGLYEDIVIDVNTGQRKNIYKEVSENFSDGLAWIKTKDDKYGYIDTKGELKIPPKYTSAQDFHEGLALVNDGNSKIFIDTNNKIILNSGHFVSLENGFGDGVALVMDGNWKTGFIYNPLSSWEDRYPFQSRSPKLSSVYKSQGDQMFKKQGYEDAANYYIQSIACDSTNANVWNDLGVCFDKLGNTEYALVCFEESYNLNKNKTAKDNIDLLTNRATVSPNNNSSENSWVDILTGLGNSLMNIGNSINAQQQSSYTQSGYTGNTTDYAGNVYDNNNTSQKKDKIYYERRYNNWARQAKMVYEGMTTTGYRVKEDGKNKGGSNNHTYYVQQKKLLRQAQQNMQKIRMQAAQDGYTLTKSEYEDAQVSI